MVKPIRIHWIILLPLILVLLPPNSRSKEKPFRPKVGDFPPLEKALIPIKVSSLLWTMPTGVAVYESMEMEGFGLPLRPPLPSSPTV